MKNGIDEDCREILADIFEVDKSEITAEKSLVLDFKANELDMMYMHMWLQEELGIILDETKFSTVQTVADVCRMVSEAPEQTEDEGLDDSDSV